ncbi:TetR/AcrR family transcriptional regulator [Maricurvus nonylphenolicus]|uniref:TetR/AcrR family transcriptional regulator n=1 Tax=Maricurvus nonylphenolicus TaxID=1008307 RepID=UPI0036F370A1
MLSKRTQAERVAESDEAVFNAAIALIASEGVSSLSIHKVGKLAGYTSGVVVHRFKNKSGLMKAVAKKVLDIWDRNLELHALDSNSAIGDINTVTTIYLKHVKRCDNLMLAYFRLMQESHCSCKEIQPEFEEYDLTVRKTLVNLIERGIGMGEIKASVNAESFAIAYIGMLRGVALQYYIHKREIDLESVGYAINSLCESLRT